MFRVFYRRVWKQYRLDFVLKQRSVVQYRIRWRGLTILPFIILVSGPMPLVCCTPRSFPPATHWVWLTRVWWRPARLLMARSWQEIPLFSCSSNTAVALQVAATPIVWYTLYIEVLMVQNALCITWYAEDGIRTGSVHEQDPGNRWTDGL